MMDITSLLMLFFFVKWSMLVRMMVDRDYFVNYGIWSSRVRSNSL